MADFNDQFQKFTDTPDKTSSMDPKDIEQNKVMAILAYLWLLVLVPIFAARESKFATFHANQGLILAIAEIALGLVSLILSWIPILGILISIVCWIAGLCLLILAIIGIVNAANGKAKELPIIGKIRIRK